MGTLNERAGRVMKEIRESRKMSKSELARLMEVDGATIFRLENNVQKFDLVKIEAFCRAAKVNQLTFFRKVAQVKP